MLISNRIKISFIALGFTVLGLAISINASEQTTPKKTDALLKLIRTPVNNQLSGVAELESNYKDKSEYEALTVLRSFFDYIAKHEPNALRDSDSKSYSLFSAEYKLKSSEAIKSWNAQMREEFSATIINWKSSEPKIVNLGYSDYLLKLSEYVNSEILGYIIDDKSAYVFVTEPNSNRFQIIQLAWSDKNAPYFMGYHLIAKNNQTAASKDTIFSPEFIASFNKIQNQR